MRIISFGSAIAALVAGPALADEMAPPASEGEVVVIGDRHNLLRIAGSGATVEAEDLERSRVFTVNEALRQVAGVFPREEEGIGLRPNVGIRGLSPIRSTKVLLLEDGLPLAYAPYGDNASYSHPPIRRFERIEVLKGASQVRFGPNTVGGVVNYISPAAPEAFEGSLQLAGGTNGYVEVDGSLGGPIAGFRVLAHANTTSFDGVRKNHGLAFNDFYLKAERELSPRHDLALRLGLFRENSQVSYSGLTQAEFAADPYGNPFPNDRFETERFTGAFSHIWRIADGATLTTSVYSLWFDRDWWRQSSNSAQRPNDASDPACAGMANLNTTCGTEGRLREYTQYGAESRLAWTAALGGAPLSLEAGVRWHTERQNRLQINADTPTGRSPGVGVNGGVTESNLRYADALSAFVTAQAEFGRLTVSPGVRVERIDYERINRLTGARGETELTETIPGLGVTFALREDMALYAGVHRGFAPPRVEDIVTNAGGDVDLDAERSVNWELGLRGEAATGLHVDVAAFLMDFENQIVPASVAGGVGATLTSAGETRHSGAEASVRGSLRDMGLMTGANDVFFRTALTWVNEADFVGARFSNIAGFGAVSVSGNRLPYAPEWIASAAVGYERGDWLTLQAEVQHTGEMFADDLNTVAPVANGQRGLIAEGTTLNLAANLRQRAATFYVTGKNVTDEVFIVDRARGILPGAPRLVQVGVRFAF